MVHTGPRNIQRQAAGAVEACGSSKTSPTGCSGVHPRLPAMHDWRPASMQKVPSASPPHQATLQSATLT